VSDEQNNDTISPQASFLMDLRERVAGGESGYGPVGSPKQVDKLAEIDAKLAVARQLGEAPPAVEPWTPERAAKERLQREFPSGDPSARPVSVTMAKWAKDRIEGLSRLSARAQGDLVQSVAEDFKHQTSDASRAYSFHRGGVAPTGPGIVDRLMKDAEPAIGHLTAAEQQLLRADRQLLEFYSLRGRAISAYSARKAQLGIK
jgi:hypothetical protein